MRSYKPHLLCIYLQSLDHACVFEGAIVLFADRNRADEAYENHISVWKETLDDSVLPSDAVLKVGRIEHATISVRYAIGIHHKPRLDSHWLRTYVNMDIRAWIDTLDLEMRETLGL